MMQQGAQGVEGGGLHAYRRSLRSLEVAAAAFVPLLLAIPLLAVPGLLVLVPALARLRLAIAWRSVERRMGGLVLVVGAGGEIVVAVQGAARSVIHGRRRRAVVRQLSDVFAGQAGDFRQTLPHQQAQVVPGNLLQQRRGEGRQVGLAFQGGGVGLEHQLLEEVLRQRLGLLGDACAEGILALGAYQAVRVLPLGEEQEAHALAVLQVRQHRLQGAPGRLAAGLVAVETEQDARYQAEQALDVFLAGRRAEGRHRVADALLGQGDDIHVALDHHDLVEVAILLPGLVESVEFLALVEDRSLRGVQVLRLVVAEHPAAEGDDPPAAVADREHHAIAEAVVALAGVAVLHQQAGVEHGLELQVVATQVLEQVVPAGRGETEAEVAGDLAGQAAALQVVHRGFARGVAFQRLLVELGGGAEQRVERRVGRLARRVPASAAFLARHVHAGALGQFLDRLGELQLVVVHDEAERVAAGAAAEAVVELLVRADGERGSLFLVERAAGAVVLAGFLQLDA